MKAERAAEPPQDCVLCPRLAAFRAEWAEKEPGWRNAPALSFGPEDATLLVVGLAPGLRGANRTGRPFTGDFSGAFLYQTMIEHRFAQGVYADGADDGLELAGAMVTNAVRCVPPKNKPIAAEINNCRSFLSGRIMALLKLKAILCLGRIAHDSTVRALGAALRSAPFGHGARHSISSAGRDFTLFDSYHCSRYNVNTGVLTAEMFRGVFAAIRAEIDAG